MNIQASGPMPLSSCRQKYRTDATGFKLTHTQINGGLNNQNDPGVEANLDVQYVTGIAYPTKVIYYSTGGSPPYIADSNTPSNTNEPYLDWLNYIGNQTTIPATFSSVQTSRFRILVHEAKVSRHPNRTGPHMETTSRLSPWTTPLVSATPLPQSVLVAARSSSRLETAVSALVRVRPTMEPTLSSSSLPSLLPAL